MPLSAPCMRVLLRFRMGAHSLPVVQERRTGAPRAQHLCLLCDQRAVGDESHMVFECPALQGVRHKHADCLWMALAPCMHGSSCAAGHVAAGCH